MCDGTADFLAADGHRHFSVACFNQAWTYIDKPARTPAEDEEMVLCALSSLWHWTQRPDCTDRHRSVGHWQVSRALALAGRGEEAMRHAMKSIRYAEADTAFYRGYAHEAAARASKVRGDADLFRKHLEQARQCATDVVAHDEREGLEADLKSLGNPRP